ncbi:hypothetical protein LVD15_12110 [Fulvivirga maritima]|uniref:hypothetical protein n=1 Tax=Fulvivirga maritima TaxID=2904247 RepID=UPI001F1B2322|nr:hypothetical protein [Fulvivirga maritima]UII29139.1 hypothetical protein LVD15_12110 [Fulvivirga maritima]
MKQILFALLLLSPALSNAQVQHNFEKGPENTNCHELPAEFTNYVEAIKALSTTTFRLKETLSISKHLTPQALRYYSCDGKTGYLVAKESDSVFQVYPQVPYKLWQEFSESKDPVYFYSEKIKKQYAKLPEEED